MKITPVSSCSSTLMFALCRSPTVHIECMLTVDTMTFGRPLYGRYAFYIPRKLEHCNVATICVGSVLNPACFVFYVALSTVVSHHASSRNGHCSYQPKLPDSRSFRDPLQMYRLMLPCLAMRVQELYVCGTKDRYKSDEPNTVYQRWATVQVGVENSPV